MEAQAPRQSARSKVASRHLIVIAKQAPLLGMCLLVSCATNDRNNPLIILTSSHVGYQRLAGESKSGRSALSALTELISRKLAADQSASAMDPAQERIARDSAHEQIMCRRTYSRRDSNPQSPP